MFSGSVLSGAFCGGENLRELRGCFKSLTLCSRTYRSPSILLKKGDLKSIPSFFKGARGIAECLTAQPIFFKHSLSQKAIFDRHCKLGGFKLGGLKLGRLKLGGLKLGRLKLGRSIV